ncbi:MAG: 16S rRNA (adenine(1518)-N(6)/adenine(1519)-N(6))-dimethyltransferase RsmA [Elusimicrobiales bacterium]|nr:16S rRNA (adenine(1518)-N(6)/adenine(1519)-N(6))-dimethyltransferase RsmA [Elusimicrobiales bacterium]HOJ85767.1 16S rRNA (adenine(1518)-N(6)/adenine(1519)-N(6))-dimethyltransferase RsmA [Elusimicrobiales bacterium]HOL61974.1 16S rRNA (adenine(1518)-N(6)/adenine(1519)-N(6))-dimethyltransferase RsmA [Elusimicrobiales bacterium]HPO94524.1 16S rRNA (adenine(1518)-N(6)/adenine(1519)-N(6))-dimethyltransferase RsmA [Elusimicrobiales bacterium]
MRRKYSQIFLKDTHIAKKITDVFAEIAKDNRVAEIGPGKGVLTDFLFKKYKDNLTVIDIDPEMIEWIKLKYPGIKFINSDFLKISLQELNTSYFIGNLPYHISTAIIEKLITYPNFKAGVFMLQKEVCKKITADEKSPDYGYLSALVNLICRTGYLFDVYRESFSPSPNVDSGIVSIEKTKDQITDEDFKKYSRFIGYAFRHKRKTLVNSINLSIGYPKDKLSEILLSKSISPNVRAQELPPEKLLEISKLVI